MSEAGSCEGCGGACCRYVMIVIGKTHDPDRKRWLRTRGAYNPNTGEWRISARCRLLDDAGRCSEYEDRPSICRVWEVGSKQCKAAREAWAQERRDNESEA